MAWRLDQPVDPGAVPPWVLDLSEPWQPPAEWEPPPMPEGLFEGIGGLKRWEQIAYYDARQAAKRTWLENYRPDHHWRDTLRDIEIALGRRRAPRQRSTS